MSGCFSDSRGEHVHHVEKDQSLAPGRQPLAQLVDLFHLDHQWKLTLLGCTGPVAALAGKVVGKPWNPWRARLFRLVPPETPRITRRRRTPVIYLYLKYLLSGGY
jgi:hypothetical protein